MTALRALLAGIVDYAGLFPPAALDMATAVRNYAEYRADDNAWMLGRFVVPVARLEEFASAHAALATDAAYEWRLTALVGQDIDADIRRVRAFNDANGGRASIDSLEAKVSTADEIRRAANVARSGLTVFVELPLDSDPGALLAEVKRAGINAKIRTGGVTAESIPAADLVVRFVRGCVNADVAFKATAGLHHPLRAEYRLTYDTAAPTGTMFGYLNVFLCAVFIAAGMNDADAVRLLDERHATAFDVAGDEIAWNGHRLTEEHARRVRERVAVSFGSCSFREPVDELRTLALT